MAVQPILKIRMVKFADVLKKQTNKTSITKHKQQQQQNTLSQIKKELKDILLVRPFRTYVILESVRIVGGL